MATWNDIKKLAADFHRVQLGESDKKLSERNCIEVVSSLIEKCLIDVIFSIDGKEYVTREYLRTQIVDETLASGGRASLTDLQQILNIHYQSIENEARHIADTRAGFSLCLGQLISREYFDRIFREIDDKLQEAGRLTLSDIAKLYDLPTDVLVPEIIKQLGSAIRATVDAVDSSVLYTRSYVELQQCLLRGALNALTRPTQVHRLVSELHLEPGLFFPSYDALVAQDQIRGTLTGGKLLDRAVFTPDVFVESTKRFVKNFFYQNGFIEHSSLKKLPHSDFAVLLRKLFGEHVETLTVFKNTVVSSDVLDNIEAAVVDAMKQNDWADVSASVTVPLTQADIVLLVQLLNKKHGKYWHLCDDNVFYTKRLIDRFMKEAESVCCEKASALSSDAIRLMRSTFASSSTVKSNVTSVESKRTKTGGGVKNKKKDAAWRQNEHSENTARATLHNGNTVSLLEFMSQTQLAAFFHQRFADDHFPTSIVEEIASKLVGPLNTMYKEKIESIYLTSETSSTKKNHTDFKEKFKVLFQNICLFDNGTSIFNDLIAEQLKTLLLRTLCTDLVNLTVGFYGHVPNAAQITPKIRENTIEGMPDPSKSCFQKLNASLTDKDLNRFFDAVDEISAPSICSLNVRSPDKKSRFELIQRHRMELLNQLENCQDASSGLLISCLLLVSKFFDTMLHATGKFVPQIVNLLQDKLPSTLYTLIVENQRLVVMTLKNKDDPQLKDDLSQKLSTLAAEIPKLFSLDDRHP